MSAIPLDQTAPSIRVDHVAEAYQLYPGETLTLFTQVQILSEVRDLRVQISVPAALLDPKVIAAHGPNADAPGVRPYEGGRDIIWSLPGSSAAGQNYEFILETQIAASDRDYRLETQATVSADVEGNTPSYDESLQVDILAKGRYLEHLPGLYYDDELMGRLLMLFESFLGPIEGQIDAITYYFEPHMTPPEFIPWLASWISLVIDERWPEETSRELLASAAYLYRKRGTQAGLSRYLEIYTGQAPEIVEHRASDFRLGSDARLGIGIALGRGNIPHTFTVNLKLPALRSDHDSITEADEARLELQRRRVIENIIESEKPAHTTYTLNLDIIH